ncbi:MAG: hypothetical protein V8S97_02180 [Oscillospiraceae bacterium]
MAAAGGGLRAGGGGPRPRGRGRRAELPDELADAAPLLAPAPYDGLYRHYVEAQIHYANGELERYNNAMALWNNGLMTLRDSLVQGASAPAAGPGPAPVLKEGGACIFRS